MFVWHIHTYSKIALTTITIEYIDDIIYFALTKWIIQTKHVFQFKPAAPEIQPNKLFCLYNTSIQEQNHGNKIRLTPPAPSGKFILKINKFVGKSTSLCTYNVLRVALQLQACGLVDPIAKFTQARLYFLLLSQDKNICMIPSWRSGTEYDC